MLAAPPVDMRPIQIKAALADCWSMAGRGDPLPEITKRLADTLRRSLSLRSLRIEGLGDGRPEIVHKSQKTVVAENGFVPVPIISHGEIVGMISNEEDPPQELDSFQLLELCATHLSQLWDWKRQRLTSELRRQSLERFARQAPYPIIALDAEQRVELWNSAASKLFGWSETETIGRKPPQLTAAEWNSFRDLSGQAETSRQSLHGKFQCCRREGAPVSASVTFLSLGTGNRSERKLITFWHVDTKECEEQLPANLTAQGREFLDRFVSLEEHGSEWLMLLCAGIGAHAGEVWRRGTALWTRQAVWADSRQPLAELRQTILTERGWSGPSSPPTNSAAFFSTDWKHNEWLPVPAISGVPQQFCLLKLHAAPDEYFLLLWGRQLAKENSFVYRELETLGFEFGQTLARRRLQRRVSETEQMLQQCQKLDAIGLLAAGLSHDFRNLLTVMLGNADLLLSELSGEDPRRHLVQDIRQAGLRGAALTRTLLGFAKNSTSHTETLNLNACVQEMARMIGRVLGPDIKIVLNLSPEAVWTRIDGFHFQQVLLNLALNARDAMPQGGTLTVSIRSELLSGSQARQLASAPPGHYSILRVSDTGCGMDEQTANRIFEPFFTTKPRGHGTGLGLTMARRILTENRGAIGVESRLGSGTTLTLLFPSEKGLKEVMKPFAVDQPISPIPSGNESLLLVEEDELVRTLIQTILTIRGYKVDVAENLDLAEANPTRDLMIVSSGVSLKSLRQFLQRRRNRIPLLPVMLLVDERIASERLDWPRLAMLAKPFTTTELCEAVRRLFDGTKQTS